MIDMMAASSVLRNSEAQINGAERSETQDGCEAGQIP
jgi:Tfp pilus assembly protein PilX